MDISAQVRQKLEQIEEQLRLVLAEYPEKIALDRVRFALALTRFARTQQDMDDTTNPEIADAQVEVIQPERRTG